jgi:hypothetical protein
MPILELRDRSIKVYFEPNLEWLVHKHKEATVWEWFVPTTYGDIENVLFLGLSHDLWSGLQWQAQKGHETPDTSGTGPVLQKVDWFNMSHKQSEACKRM